MKIRQILIAATMFVSMSAAANVMAQETGKRDSDDMSSLFSSMETTPNPSSASDIRPRHMTAAEIRQARALYKARQRTARLESNLWMGHQPLRPNWNAVPMTASRYAPYRTYYVPVYYYAR